MSQWKAIPTEKRGVICGADQAQEWLLPWWWSRYAEHHAFPVTFCDFGMTEDARKWCAERGSVVKVEFHVPIARREEVDPLLVEAWESVYGTSIWISRPSWFKKPFALLHSPYEKGIWIDLDCEILQPIDLLFELCDSEAQLGIMRESIWSHLPPFHPAIVYNSGVIVFKHGRSLIEQWAEGSITLNARFLSDDALLSHLINAGKMEIEELSPIYNWRLSQGLNINAVIVHWFGAGGKEYIRKFGGLKPALNAFYRSNRESAKRRLSEAL